MAALLSRLLGRRTWPHLLGIAFTIFGVLILGHVDAAWTAPSGGGIGYYGLRLGGIAAIGLATLTAALLLTEAWTGAVRKSWWDPADTLDGPLGWGRLIELVHRHNDPLRSGGGLRVRAAILGLLFLLPALAGLAGVAETLAGFVWQPTVPPFLLRIPAERTVPDALVNLSGNLTAFLALIAASVSIWFTYSQLRAKVRAESRQEWLGRTRTLIARVIALAAEHARSPEEDRQRIFRRLDPLRLELELMLNPSEKDHRLLMYLVRRLTFVHDLAQADAADENVLVEEIRSACRTMAEKEPVRCGSNRYDIDWKPILETVRVDALVTYSMRLSHVVLKREWERVKSTR